MLITLKELKQLLHDIEHCAPPGFQVPLDAPIMLQLKGEQREFPLNIATEDGQLRFHYDGAIHIPLEVTVFDVADPGITIDHNYIDPEWPVEIDTE